MRTRSGGNRQHLPDRPTAGTAQRALTQSGNGAVYMLTLAIAAAHMAEHIGVSCVNLKTAGSRLIGRLLDAALNPVAERAALIARRPFGRLVTAQEVAATIAYLASPYTGATTGTALAVDGGMAGLRVGPASAAGRRIR